MSDNDSGLLEYIPYSFSARNELHFKIPKGVWEYAYTQSVDVIIESIDWNLYENGKSSPPLQFYGYINLVMEDCLSLEVPIHFPRQRAFDFRNESALSQWRRLEEGLKFYKKWNEFFFHFFTDHAEEPPPLPSIIFPKPYFDPSPLREVHIFCPQHTQFRVEYCQWQPVEFMGDDGSVYNGNKRTPDKPKDKGLPPDGIQPKHNQPSSPWGGNKPLTPPPSNWVLPPSNLTKPDPDNGTSSSVPPEDYGYFLKVTATARLEPSCIAYTCDYYYLVSEFDTSFTLSDWHDPVNFCGQVHQAKYLNGNYSGRIDSFYYYGDFNWTVIRAADKPQNHCTMVS